MKGHDKFAGLYKAVSQVMQEGIVKTTNKVKKNAAELSEPIHDEDGNRI